MARSDWIPSRKHELVVLMNIWLITIQDAARQVMFGWVAADCQAVAAAITAFFSAQGAYDMVPTTENCAIKESAKEKAIEAMRDFANSSIRFNKKMLNANKEAMGVHTEKKTSTSHPAPSSQPETKVFTTVNHFEHKIVALNHETSTRSKPEDAYGVRYGWQLGGIKPEKGEDLPKKRFSRKTTLVLKFTEADKGKTVYYSTCYENGKGDEGSWSLVVESLLA